MEAIVAPLAVSIFPLMLFMGVVITLEQGALELEKLGVPEGEVLITGLIALWCNLLWRTTLNLWWLVPVVISLAVIGMYLIANTKYVLRAVTPPRLESPYMQERRGELRKGFLYAFLTLCVFGWVVREPFVAVFAPFYYLIHVWEINFDEYDQALLVGAGSCSAVCSILLLVIPGQWGWSGCLHLGVAALFAGKLIYKRMDINRDRNFVSSRMGLGVNRTH